MIKLYFISNKIGLEYFRKKLSKKTSMDILLQDSNILRGELKFSWEKNGKFLSDMFVDIFSITKDVEFTIEVFPEYFYLGAINIEKRILLLGQPKHSRNHYMALLGHELTHYFIRGRCPDRIVEETICFMFERRIIEELDHVNSEDFSYLKNISTFHLRALSYAHKHYWSFKEYFRKKDIDGLFEYLKEVILIEDKNILIPSNIISYINFIDE